MTTIEELATTAPTASRPLGAPVVSVVATTPETVLADVERAMRLAGAEQVLSPDLETLLKINISWQHWYPGCSTAPWQLEGVVCALHNLGPLRPDCRSQRHRRRRFLRGRGQQPPQTGAGQIQPAHRASRHATGTVGALRTEGQDAGAGRYLSRRDRDTANLRRQEHRPPAHHENPRLHHHDRRDEKRLRRSAAPQASTGPTR